MSDASRSPSAGPRVILRADASASVGTGHVVRSRTLAEALLGRGWRATLVTRDLPEGLADALAATAIELVRLPPAGSRESEPGEIAARIEGDAALVVGDDYDLDAAWFEGVRRRVPGAALMAIDDLADRRLPADLILNQNLGASAAAYAGLLPVEARILAGPMYALLRPEFARLRARRRTRDGQVERILVFMSGADDADVTARAVVGLGQLGQSRRAVDVVVGAAYPHLPGLRGIVDRTPGTRLHVNTGAMAELMDAADLAIGAASSASWERCALGLPAVLVTLADNQVAAEHQLVDAGAATAIGWHTTVTATEIERAVRILGEDPARVAAMSVAAAAVTDGAGTERVVDEIEAIVTGRLEAR
ncbi:MAG: UDP-2,4-diacetamido-2,4,6-trideoxy-beta-L-altropyranose hydrolase [Chloroflexota bacterium]|nr:UDP-2,4-diacetamido-2,4,6-trideoxy-beta-L-altropyranose hydrolase [Chloroflexota bacterium]